MDELGRTMARLLAGALAAGLAMNVGMVARFGPAQGLLADPARQSAEFLAVMGAPRSRTWPRPPPRWWRWSWCCGSA
ncbi:MAG: hypothetical protein R3F59_37860 [Myxococcota bacterium]